jgi:hypothetical protein
VIATVYRIGVGVALAGVVAFGGNVFGIAIATADPNNDLVWDIEVYDDCMNQPVHDANQCCIGSGGVPSDEPLEGGRGQKCQAATAGAEASEAPMAARL